MSAANEPVRVPYVPSDDGGCLVYPDTFLAAHNGRTDHRNDDLIAIRDVGSVVEAADRAIVTILNRERDRAQAGLDGAELRLAEHEKALRSAEYECDVRGRALDEERLFNAELTRQLEEGTACLGCGTKFHAPDLDGRCPVCKARAEAERSERVLADVVAEVTRRLDRLGVAAPSWPEAFDALEAEVERLREALGEKP